MDTNPLELEPNRLLDFFEHAPAPICLLSGPDHRYDFVNAACVKVAGRSREEMIGRTVREVFPELEAQGFVGLLDQVYRTGEAFFATEKVVEIFSHGQVETAFFDFSYCPVRNASGQVEGILLQGIETTEQVLARNQLEARVRERTAELEKVHSDLRSLNYLLLKTQEEERRRLALELHDGAGQLLAALKWKTLSLQRDAAGSSPAVQKSTTDSLRLLDELTKELRTVSHLLHPPLLEEGGLSALRLYFEGVEERSGLVVTLDLDPRLNRLPDEVELTIFRVVQEALTNIHRHAQTNAASVRIFWDDGTNIQLEIQDRGKGIVGFTSLDSSTLKVGMGMRGMRERIRQLNGQFEIVSDQNGTTLNASLPLTPSQAEHCLMKAP
jgi:PAS domain S-box-containing protein